eukprot:scaffold4980_cov72-Skeletonema_dohrnii-CCMP3373.AAC.2
MPLTSAFFTCGIKASAADIVAQQRGAIQLVDEEGYKTNPIDDIETKRNIAFLLYGGLYQGIAQQIIFNNIFPRMFGQGTDVLTVMSKILEYMGPCSVYNVWCGSTTLADCLHCGCKFLLVGYILDNIE